MLKFQHIILKKFLALFFILFLTVGAIVYYWLEGLYLESSQKALIQNLKFLTLQITPKTNFDALAYKTKQTTSMRLTVIDKDGVVIAESHKDKRAMDNHLYRPEIILANTQQFASAIRHSHTLHKELLYVATKITLNSHPYYIRLAREFKGIQNAIYSLGLKIFAVLLVFIGALFFITYKLNLSIQKEMTKIVEFLKSLTKKNKDTYISSSFSEEFDQMSKLLTKVAHILVKKEQVTSRHTQHLEEANRQKDDIISAISHEFKNPIAVVNGYSQTLLEDENINPNIRKKFLKKIYKNGTKLSELIDTLRLSMKLDSKQQKLSTRKVNLYNLTKETAQNLQISYPKKEVIISGDTTKTIDVDETLFGIVLSNLIENGFKYSEDELHINITPYSLDVIDTGIGIKSQDLEKITQKFFRVQTNSWNNSLGLGLFLVNNIVTLHGFKLKIISKENEGSTFSIVF